MPEHKGKGHHPVVSIAAVAIGIAAAFSLSQAFGTVTHPGDIMPDGTVFAGHAAFTQEPLYVTPQDAPDVMAWREAKSYCEQLEAHGHKDWYLPDSSDIHVIFKNSAAIGGFNTSETFPAESYWSSSEHDDGLVTFQGFNGIQSLSGKNLALSVRCVRHPVQTIPVHWLPVDP